MFSRQFTLSTNTTDSPTPWLWLESTFFSSAPSLGVVLLPVLESVAAESPEAREFVEF